MTWQDVAQAVGVTGIICLCALAVLLALWIVAKDVEQP